MNQRLALGTAQFGMSYGIANSHGQVNPKEIAAIVESAWSNGMNTLDTAQAYGESQANLGKAGVEKWRVVTKLPILPEKECYPRQWVDNIFKQAINQLNLERVYGLLLHYPEQLLTPYGIRLYEAMNKLKVHGVVQKIGISVYQPETLSMITKHFDFDLVQLPFNILDRRFLHTEWLKRLKASGIEIHARSIFLQGLLLMKTSERPSRFYRWNTIWDEWQHWIAETCLTPLQACLSFVLKQQEIDRVIIGVDSLAQLHEIFEAAHVSHVPSSPDAFFSEDPDLIDPRNWNR